METVQHLGSSSPNALLDSLHHMLDEAMERAGAIDGTIEALGHTFSSRSDRSVHAPRLLSSFQAAVHTRIIPTIHVGGKLGAGSSNFAANSCRPVNVPLFYQGQQQGLLFLKIPIDSEHLRQQHERDVLGREYGLRVARIDICQWARHHLDLDIPIIGTSASLARLEAGIAKVGPVNYAVVLEADFGAHDVEFAAAIHASSPRRHQPFVVLHCSYPNLTEFDLHLNDAWTRAADGSLFVSGIDMLDHAAQRQLLYRLRLGRQSRSTARILVSTTFPLSSLESEGKFCRMLRTELDVLHIRVPPLRERKDDIRALLEHYLRKHGFEQFRRLSPAAWQTCVQYDWPGNEAELERFAIRIAVMTESTCIDLPDLQNVASWLPVEPLREPIREVQHWIAPEGEDFYEENEEPTPSQRQWLELLAGRLVAREFVSLETFGTPIQRALRYVGEHYQDEISLTQLARESFVSVSHLSFLFKRTVGVPFKTLLAAVRIEKARQLLLENPSRTITEISLDAGFGDLSHFERTFKRLIGTNPRDYRRQQRTASATAP